jgi:hypothetical protein
MRAHCVGSNARAVEEDNAHPAPTTTGTLSNYRLCIVTLKKAWPYETRREEVGRTRG